MFSFFEVTLPLGCGFSQSYCSRTTLFPIPCKTCPKSLKSFTPLAGVTLPGQRFEWHPLVLGYFLPLKVAGCCAGGFLLVSVHTLNTVSRRKENRSSPKTPAKSWVLENSLGALAKVIPQSKNRSVFWRNEGEQSLEITTGQVGKVTDRRAVSSKTLLSFRMFLDSRYVCIVLWPVYETDSSIKLSYLSRNIHKVDDAKAGNTFTTFFNTSRSLQYDQVKKKDWAVHIFKSQC